MATDQLAAFRKAVTGDYIVPIKDACKHNGQYAEAYSIGYSALDKAMAVESDKEINGSRGGVRNGDLIIITGISGSGKTTLCQNIVLNLNRIAVPSVFFSYEVIIDHVYAKFKQMGMSDDDLIYAPKETVSGNVGWVAEKIKEAKEKYNAKVIALDHIEFLTPTDASSGDQLRIRLGNISRELKALAVKEEVIIFLMAHVKKVQGRAVEMQDIGEASGIYKEADYVFSIGRYYDIKDLGGGRDITITTNEGMITMLKNRLTGDMGYLEFQMRDNIIIPLIK